ncbi:Glutamyl-tRNA reductase-binding protein, chloroplastic [Porphyridium purpureum]|uniref:Glutamyl-tRNA reductase-binding protein, chloroplastic n=1 Tax=Porphyridium purpureum TaxID=35688 RepID=A0A5J4Z1D6_PORPP|nr:Glutamyl-tRNA reductase-binding protein, chloroplastic [Porphyridium purpureum]|eukprot:POR6471..scf208_2
MAFIVFGAASLCSLNRHASVARHNGVRDHQRVLVGRGAARGCRLMTMNVQQENSSVEKKAQSVIEASRPTGAEQCRTIAATATSAALATVHDRKGDEDAGVYPFASMVELAVDEQGRPILGMSTLSAHTRDLASNPRASVCIIQKGWSSIRDSRVTLVGECVKPADAKEQEALKVLYRAKHPHAFWVDFGDFSMFRMEKIVEVRYVGGIGRAGSINVDAYLQAQPDPLMDFVDRIIGHMNKDHEDEIKAIVQHYAPLEQPGGTLVSAKMAAMDKKGMDVLVIADIPDEASAEEVNKMKRVNFTQRLAFPFEASDRKLAKEVLVAMTNAAAAGAAT